MEGKGRQTEILDFDASLAQLPGKPGRRPNNKNRGKGQQKAGNAHSSGPAKQNGIGGAQNGTNARKKGLIAAAIKTDAVRFYETPELKIPLFDGSTNRRRTSRKTQTLEKKYSRNQLLECVKEYDKTGHKYAELQKADTKAPIIEWINKVEVEAMGESTASAKSPTFSNLTLSTEQGGYVNTGKPGGEGAGPFTQQGGRKKPTNQNDGLQKPSMRPTQGPPKRKLDDEDMDDEEEKRRAKRKKLKELSYSQAMDDNSEDDELRAAIMAGINKQAEEVSNLISRSIGSTTRRTLTTSSTATIERSTTAARPTPALPSMTVLSSTLVVPPTTKNRPTPAPGTSTNAGPNQDQRKRRRPRPGDLNEKQVKYSDVLRTWQRGMTEHPLIETIGLGARVKEAKVAGESIQGDIDIPELQEVHTYCIISKTDGNALARTEVHQVSIPYAVLPSKKHLVPPEELKRYHPVTGVRIPYLKEGMHGEDSNGACLFEGDQGLVTGEGHQIDADDKEREDEERNWEAWYKRWFATAKEEDIAPQVKKERWINKQWRDYYEQRYPKHHWSNQFSYWPCGCQKGWDADWSEDES